MDLVPPHFDRLLDGGCPECGAAWLELRAIGFLAPRLYSGEATWTGRYLNVTASSLALDRLWPRAARVRCFSGHSWEFDSFSGQKRPAIDAAGYLLGTGIAVLGVTALLCAGWFATARRLR